MSLRDCFRSMWQGVPYGGVSEVNSLEPPINYLVKHLQRKMRTPYP